MRLNPRHPLVHRRRRMGVPLLPSPRRNISRLGSEKSFYRKRYWSFICSLTASVVDADADASANPDATSSFMDKPVYRGTSEQTRGIRAREETTDGDHREAAPGPRRRAPRR